MSENPHLPAQPIAGPPALPAYPPAYSPYSGAPPYGQPVYAPGPPPPVASGARSAMLGIVALVLAIVAVVASVAVAALAGAAVGAGVGEAIANTTPGAPLDAHLFSPVRGWVLAGEIAFWAGTVLGTWALVQGIIAIASRRGLGQGIAAVTIAVIGPVAYFLAIAVMFSSGTYGAVI